ncbi:M15 family metallopeptidase [Bacillus sp. FJAT-27225]|uniref:M15 family metallopeptidase n=1 Tax=Bacillus sp. FJAT-27225 TaxID=1743144 RepID=UPI000A46BCBB|nr:M15 family metallopeptidase [Bacillus sp. FJAT-27225]
MRRLILAFLLLFTLLVSGCVNGDEKQTVKKETPAATTEEENKPDPPQEEAVQIQAHPYKGELELPVAGATGYTSVDLYVKASANHNSENIEQMKAGTGFVILREEGDWWFIQRGEVTGWLPHTFCFINLPDVIPSIIYDNTNTYSSRFASSGKDIPNISKRPLYSGKAFNERLGKEEYIMPVLYTMSKKIFLAQQKALSDGDSLKIYEAFRPYSVQIGVVKGLSDLATKDAEVMAGINTPPWGISWFITNGVSNHQMGYAIDVSLVKVNAKNEVSVGDYTVTQITEYTEYEMPTPIHELSGASAIYTAPVTSRSPTAWKNMTYTKSMNDAAKKLQIYCTSAGLIPLASEWWHFNDLEAMNEIANNKGEGKFVLTEVYSVAPKLEVAS